MIAALRLALVFATLAFVEAGGCGFTPSDLKGEGEPCTRTSECRASLECRGGVCMGEADGGPEPDAAP